MVGGIKRLLLWLRVYLHDSFHRFRCLTQSLLNPSPMRFWFEKGGVVRLRRFYRITFVGMGRSFMSVQDWGTHEGLQRSLDSTEEDKLNNRDRGHSVYLLYWFFSFLSNQNNSPSKIPLSMRYPHFFTSYQMTLKDDLIDMVHQSESLRFFCVET